MQHTGLSRARSVEWAERHRLRVIRAAAEINRQQAAGAAARCGFCGFWEPRHLMEADDADGVQRLCCPACVGARADGLESRLDLARMREAIAG